MVKKLTKQERSKKFYEEHKGKPVEHKEVSCIFCGDKFTQKHKNHKICEKKECKKEGGRRYWKGRYNGDFKEKYQSHRVNDYKEDPDYHRGMSQKSYLKNKDKKLKSGLEYIKKRYRTDESFRIRMNLTNSLRDVIREYIKTGKIVKRLEKYGIDWEGIINQLKPFPKDRSKYDADHIIPLSRFDFTDIDQVHIAFAPENHRWLLKKDNLKRNRKIKSVSFSEGKNK